MRLPVVLVSLLVLATACSGDPDPSGPDRPGAAPTVTPAPTAATTPTEPLPSRAPWATDRVRTGHAPCGILGVGGRVWVSNFNDDTLVSVDPRTMAVSRPVPIGQKPCGLAFGAGSIWTANYGSFDATRVSVATGEVEATYDVGYSPYDVAFAAGAAWVTNNGSGTVSRIDAGTGRVTRVRTGGTPVGIAPTAGRLWVALGKRGIAAIDARSGRVVERIATDGPAGWTAYDGDRVWVNVGATVVEIDARTATVTRTLDVGEAPEDGSVVGRDVWVGDRSGLLYRFGTDGGPVREVPSTVGNPFVLAGFRDALWVVDFAGTQVVRIDPTRAP